MKKLTNIKLSFLFCLCLAGQLVVAQEEKPEPSINLRYVSDNNNMQYLEVQAKIKADNKLQPLKDMVFSLYLDSVSAENLIGKVTTNEKGTAKTILPVNLKDKWTASGTHKFIGVSEATKAIEETTTEASITKARITMDTLNEDGVRSVAVKVDAFDNGNWIPAKDVELKIGVRRLGGELKIGDDESYTTDSLGQVTAEFKIDSLPAIDAKGNIVLVAKVDDNENYGSLSIDKTVPWGAYYKRTSNWGQRALWAARFKAPIWLYFIAYSIIAAVWSVIIYLVFQIIKISKLGKEAEAGEKEKVKTMETALTD